MKKAMIIILLVAATGTLFAQSESDFRFQSHDGIRGIIYDYTGTARQVVIPETINGIRVTSISGPDVHNYHEYTFQFANKGLTSVTIPNSITQIGQAAFFGNQLTSVIIPDSVENMHGAAFAENQLTSVTIGNGLTYIVAFGFNKNRLTSVAIGNRVASIGFAAFAHNQLASVVIPNSVTRIDDAAFFDNPLTRITIGANVEINEKQHPAFPNNFGAFYQGQGRRAGTYAWDGRLWRVQ